MKQKITLDEDAVKTIEYVISKGHRAEVVPAIDGAKILIVKREEVKNERRKHGLSVCKT